jgi:hypothetical protein
MVLSTIRVAITEQERAFVCTQHLACTPLEGTDNFFDHPSLINIRLEEE